MMQVNVPEPITEFLLKNMHLRMQLDSYCKEHYSIKESKDILVDFFTEHGLGEEVREALRKSGVKGV